MAFDGWVDRWDFTLKVGKDSLSGGIEEVGEQWQRWDRYDHHCHFFSWGIGGTPLAWPRDLQIMLVNTPIFSLLYGHFEAWNGCKSYVHLV